MLVDESLDHLQVTKGAFKGERSVSILIHCNCRFKQFVGTKLTVPTQWTHTFWVTLMILSKINDHIPVSMFYGQKKWGPTGLVRCTCIGVLKNELLYYYMLYKLESIMA